MTEEESLEPMNFLILDEILMYERPLLTEPKFKEKIYVPNKEYSSNLSKGFLCAACCYCCPIGVWSFTKGI